MELTVDVQGPSRKGYLVVVSCPHGETRMPWKRTCGNGCHRGGWRRRQRCTQVNPSDRLLTVVGVTKHGIAWGCGCDEVFWMTEGPEHHHLDQPHVHPREGPLSAEDRAKLSQCPSETAPRVRGSSEPGGC